MTPEHTKINSFEITLNTSEVDFADGAKPGCVDVQSVVQHELGHALGIAHCHEESSGITSGCSNTMHWWITPNSVQQRYLKDYDKSSKQVIYW